MTRGSEDTEVYAFYEPRTSSIQYIVADPQSRCCAIIDPVLDYDEVSGSISTRSADALLKSVGEHHLTLEWILDTHPHADHFSAADYLRRQTGCPIAIGEHIIEVQRLWQEIYNLPAGFPTDGSQWDRLFADGERFRIGRLDAEVIFSPGHTLASVTYRAGSAAFVHDTLFMPDGGTARADFPGGDARHLWRSIQRILAFPPHTRLFTGHDYRPGGRPPAWESSIAEQRMHNAHLAWEITEDDFVMLREARDRTLALPRLMLHALQVNIAGGCLPQAEANGRRYLKVPLGAFNREHEYARGGLPADVQPGA